MRTTYDLGRKEQFAKFVHDTKHGVLIECSKCGEHQEISDDESKTAQLICSNATCKHEIFYYGNHRW